MQKPRCDGEDCQAVVCPVAANGSRKTMQAITFLRNHAQSMTFGPQPYHQGQGKEQQQRGERQEGEHQSHKRFRMSILRASRIMAGPTMFCQETTLMAT